MPAISVRERMDEDQPVMKPHGGFVRGEGRWAGQLRVAVSVEAAGEFGHVDEIRIVTVGRELGEMETSKEYAVICVIL